MDQKIAATKRVKSLDLQPDMRTRALVLVASDNASGSSLRDLLQLNDGDKDLKSLVVSFLQQEAIGRWLTSIILRAVPQRRLCHDYAFEHMQFATCSGHMLSVQNAYNVRCCDVALHI